ncbi:MarR family winged helix-turn-helix transcriptional regulator [Allorhodopirellula solitaria]|uniref:HTH-type transcriptional regulator MhqR n=1 Tax=Allorhodopirellula solitaria TaxID=2527987 RepID=A0A5C5YHH3_9BACT|nr:MarR family transcriptional regulator [Allorhodopirellula solitaria]TWT72882.1 HTH-type transcriptional regulator MhqR [Allorhodopirellula solitaria]
MAKAPTNAATATSPSYDSLEQEVFLNLWRTYDRLKLMEDEVFGRVGLSAQQYNALRLLRSVHPAAMPTLVLGGRLISRAPDMTRLLDRLEKKGLLLRERKPENRRVVEVRITEKGTQLLDEVHDAVQECHQQQLGHLNRKDLRQMVDLLRQARQPHEDANNLSFIDE